MWLEDKRFRDLIKEWWNSFHVAGWVGYRFSSKLKMLKNKIKDWTKCNLEPVGPLKAKILEELQSIDRKAECQRFLSEADLAKRLELKDLFE